MKKKKMAAAAFSILFFAGCAAAFAQDDLAIWKEFVAAVKAGKMTVEHIKPYEGLPREAQLKILQDFKGYHDKYKSWGEWDNPQVFPVGAEVHYLVTFTWGGQTKSDFCFTLLKENGRWYYRHVENIFIRLDKVDKFPATEFPDLPAQTKAWQREEFYWSQMVGIQTILAPEKGKDYLANLLRDGAGYYLAARAWVPFLAPERAFILYACWEQSRLRENPVSLDSLTDAEATVRIRPQFFGLYKQSVHLREQIAFEDYKHIFETIWQDRAAAAGWKLAITYEDPECLGCVLKFTRNP